MMHWTSGSIVIVTLGAGVTWSVTVMGSIVIPFAVPDTVTLCVPMGVVVFVVIFRVELEFVAGLELNVAVAPDGRDEADRVTPSE